MKYIILAVVAALFSFVGGFAAKMVSGSGKSAATGQVETASEGSGDHRQGQGSSGGHGSSGHSADSSGSHGGSDSTGDAAYFRFSREFVVPIIREGSVSSLVIVNINLEIDASLSSSLFSQEPRLRDNIMTTLMELSNSSALDDITRVENYETIRSTVLMNLRDPYPSGIRNVLILDIAKQDL